MDAMMENIAPTIEQVNFRYCSRALQAAASLSVLTMQIEGMHVIKILSQVTSSPF
jgi:hypothetical protein